MTSITSTPAANRIAQIRSAMGHSNTIARTGFATQLDTARSATPTTVFTVGEEPAAVAVPDESPVAPTRPDADAPVANDEHTIVASSVPYADLFNSAGARHGVDPALLASVAEVESGFDPSAISSAGAQGLMQFMPATAAEMDVESFDPASAVDGAARYLRRELDRFGSVDLALAAYNAGPGAVQRHDGIPPFAETERYVDKVLIALESHR